MLINTYGMGLCMSDVKLTEYIMNEEEWLSIIIHNSSGKLICSADMEGNILPEVCKQCGTNTVWNAKLDTIFCPRCNIWLEKKCTEPDCEYCQNRPEFPLIMID